MSTRAVYTFIDENESWPVYKHHDGYPSGAAEFIAAAMTKAWALPRFEPDEFATAFIAANKEFAGDLRMTNGRDSHGDLAYAYEIRCDGKNLRVKCLENSGSWKKPEYTDIFDGTLAEFTEWASKQ